MAIARARFGVSRSCGISAFRRHYARMGQTFQTKLLTVDDAFLIEGRGVIVMPGIPAGAYKGPYSRKVTLRTPDGLETAATAMIDIPRVSPQPEELYYLCLIVGLTKDEIPIGTEIWIDDSHVD
jgi:hypothetical protein